MKLWTTKEEVRLRELFPVYKTKDVAVMMGRTYRSVRDKAYDLGLVKEFDFRDLWLPGQKPKHLKKGEWAKGCERTWFQKGNRAHTRPIGYEVIRWGVLFVKVTDIAFPKGDNRQKFLANWKRKKDLVWTENKGPIPENHFVSLIDRNQWNCSIENLRLVSRSNLTQFANRDHKTYSEAAKRRWAKKRNGSESPPSIQASTNGQEKVNGARDAA